ncbi:unnamed protein product [Miscanthus lutarioriparius]|uniref:Uncharacterized protein n=1 Tax=Miscanthus lutarioriparius TaxID=422564 RepID=A0A811PQL0_9POAL|nr:unnamed protein product [Miscanthus lutarioriparius]
MTSARVLLLPCQLTMPLRLALAPPSWALARGYFLMVLQQSHRSWARAAAASSASSSSCEQYSQAPIAAAPGATSPREEKGNGELEAAACGGEKASGAQQDGSTGTGIGVLSPPAPKDSEALRAAAAAGRKGRSGALSRQRCHMAKPQGNKPAQPGSPKEG